MTSRPKHAPLNEEEQKIMDRAREAEEESMKNGILANVSRNAYQGIMRKREEERYANRSFFEKAFDFILFPLIYPIVRFQMWFERASYVSLIKAFALTIVILICFIIYACTGG